MNASIFSALLVISSAPIIEVDRCKLCGLLPEFCPCDGRDLFEVTPSGRLQLAAHDRPVPLVMVTSDDDRCPFCEEGETCSLCDGSPRPERSTYAPDIPGVNVPLPGGDEEPADFGDDDIEPPTVNVPGFGWMVI
jgi:hypothetical protein